MLATSVYITILFTVGGGGVVVVDSSRVSRTFTASRRRRRLLRLVSPSAPPSRLSLRRRRRFNTTDLLSIAAAATRTLSLFSLVVPFSCYMYTRNVRRTRTRAGTHTRAQILLLLCAGRMGGGGGGGGGGCRAMICRVIYRRISKERNKTPVERKTYGDDISVGSVEM